MKERVNFSIDHETMEKLRKKIPSGQRSEKIEELICEFLETNPEREFEVQKDYIDQIELTEGQEKLLDIIIREDLFNKSGPQVFGKVREQGHYSRKGNFKNAMKSLGQNTLVPISIDSGTPKPKNLKCECGAENSLKVFALKDGQCPNSECKKQVFKKSRFKNQSGITVVD